MGLPPSFPTSLQYVLLKRRVKDLAALAKMEVSGGVWDPQQMYHMLLCLGLHAFCTTGSKRSSTPCFSTAGQPETSRTTFPRESTIEEAGPRLWQPGIPPCANTRLASSCFFYA